MNASRGRAAGNAPVASRHHAKRAKECVAESLNMPEIISCIGAEIIAALEAGSRNQSMAMRHLRRQYRQREHSRSNEASCSNQR